MGLCMEKISPRMELYAALYGRRARVSIRGRWTLIGVGYRFRNVTFRNYREDPAILGPTGGAATMIWGEACSSSPAGLLRSVQGRPGSSKVDGIVDKVSGPTCRSAGLLAGRVHLTGTSETLVGGDPWVPMSHKPPDRCVGEAVETRSRQSEAKTWRQ
jgi:hypothetical protein